MAQLGSVSRASQSQNQSVVRAAFLSGTSEGESSFKNIQTFSH